MIYVTSMCGTNMAKNIIPSPKEATGLVKFSKKFTQTNFLCYTIHQLIHLWKVGWFLNWLFMIWRPCRNCSKSVLIPPNNKLFSQACPLNGEFHSNFFCVAWYWNLRNELCSISKYLQEQYTRYITRAALFFACCTSYFF